MHVALEKGLNIEKGSTTCDYPWIFSLEIYSLFLSSLVAYTPTETTWAHSSVTIQDVPQSHEAFLQPVK